MKSKIEFTKADECSYDGTNSDRYSADDITTSSQTIAKPTVSRSALSKLAKNFYFRDVLVEKYRDNFLAELQKRKVIDKRDEGYHCCYCSKINKSESAFTQKDRVIFPKNNNEEFWIINSHYDGCRGWD